ncbi:MAG: hypothetical protein ACM3XM_06350 [Mycobacterium leprae]
MGRLYGSLFLHANMQYAEIPKAKLPVLVQRSYLPALEALLAHPGVKVALEFSGISLEWLEQNAPDVISGVRTLVARGQAELLASTYADPILPLLPPDEGERQISRFFTVYDRIFGDLAPRPQGFYAQEYAVDASVVDLLARRGLKWVVVSSGQYKISKRGLLNSALKRIPPQEEFAAGEPVPRPYEIIGARESRIAGVTWNMPGPNDLVFAWKDGRATWAEVEAYLASLEARYCHAEDGFVLLATGDTEFVGDLPPQGNFHAPKFAELLDRLQGTDTVEMALPSAYLGEHPCSEALYLKCGAGARFSDLQNWISDPDNMRLNDLCDDVRGQIRLASAMIDLVEALGFAAQSARTELTRAQDALLLAENSDGRGWNPIPERRLDCYDQALNARDAAAAALAQATAAVRSARG